MAKLSPHNKFEFIPCCKDSISITRYCSSAKKFQPILQNDLQDQLRIICRFSFPSAFAPYSVVESYQLRKQGHITPYRSTGGPSDGNRAWTPAYPHVSLHPYYYCSHCSYADPVSPTAAELKVSDGRPYNNHGSDYLLKEQG
jgi:hypothetical protein